ncbi:MULTISPECIES: methionine ABC transporter permease [Caproicibacterium]|jgi:D-methionine transport system permease protein|uniref:ABC transporter permease subunit n=1 Tax=Caproicibacterium lactatifermentans TaxID=2666138 RepID=A0A859DNQ4_9FIRM|nr:methionine ABC transporter permease [Caproicibacterium lactatifermentans]QKN23085.1 ABC transporter permease subunit [Caproicibacterium lactatifermentans]QKO30308.1 ABC transporter permease subunit [Caproicibacterium lactatifermentans]
MIDLDIPNEKILLAAQQTIYMVGIALIIGTILGAAMAVILVLTRKGGIRPNKIVYGILNAVINVVRSIPFIILMVFIMPLTKAIVGTRIGTTAAIVPLVVFIAPYLARLLESSLLEVNRGIVEAAQSMGATTFQIIWHFLLPESSGSLILALTNGAIGLLGATAMAGAIGAGGVGDLALTYGYERMNFPLMLFTIIVLIVFVQLIQVLGNFLSRRLRHK